MSGQLICLAANLAMCLGISGNLADPEYDPLAPLALQLKLVRSAPADNVRWSETQGALCLAADPEARCAFGAERDVDLVAYPGAKWDWDGPRLRLRDSGLCLSTMECWRRAVPGSANRTYCDSRVSFLNEMSATQLAGATPRVRGSYVKLAKCAADLPAQRFVVVASAAPTASPSLAPSLAPSTEPSASPSASPSFASSLRPSASPSLRPSASPTAARITISPSASPTAATHAPPSSTHAPTAAPSRGPTAVPRSTQPTFAPNAASAEQWWPAVLAVCLLVAAGAGFAAYRKWGAEIPAPQTA